MARPLAFDPDEKLQQAMMLFWRKGYKATSMQDLVEELGINRFSLYNTFGDKQAMFLRAIERYEEQVFGRLLHALQPPEDGLRRLEAYFDSLSRGLRGQYQVGGCFLQNAMLEGGVCDPKVVERIRLVFLRLRGALADVIEGAKGLGEISASYSTEELADYLLLQAQGLIALHGLGVGPQAESALQVIKRQIHGWR